MKYITHNDHEINKENINQQGNITADYSQLCKLFGQPHASDGYKSDAGWDVEFDDGTVAVIYNWKNGKNYLGSDGYDTQKITSWNIGGHTKDALIRVTSVIEDAERIATVQGHWPEGYASFCIEEVGYTWNPNN